jgi:hypothetical protein
LAMCCIESIVSNARGANLPPNEIQLCDDSVSVCKSKFERVHTVYQYNSTKTEVQWQTSTTVCDLFFLSS